MNAKLGAYETCQGLLRDYSYSSLPWNGMLVDVSSRSFFLGGRLYPICTETSFGVMLLRH